MFQRVDAKNAGPSALGILVPLGARTLVVVRPRGLAWDLLPARWEGDTRQPPRFCTFTRDEAALVARGFVTALESAAAKKIDPLESFGDASSLARQLWLRTDDFVWIVCRRTQGQAYQPMIFASLEEAEQAAASLAAYVCPAADVVQEYYFNTQNLT